MAEWTVKIRTHQIRTTTITFYEDDPERAIEKVRDIEHMICPEDAAAIADEPVIWDDEDFEVSLQEITDEEGTLLGFDSHRMSDELRGSEES
jgi:hypothetical protein